MFERLEQPIHLAHLRPLNLLHRKVAGGGGGRLPLPLHYAGLGLGAEGAAGEDAEDMDG
jgi:hypothetical protein